MTLSDIAPGAFCRLQDGTQVQVIEHVYEDVVYCRSVIGTAFLSLAAAVEVTPLVLVVQDSGHEAPPPHYVGTEGVEVIDQIRAELDRDNPEVAPLMFAAFCRGNELKYTLRAGKKGDAAGDLLKAAWYKAMWKHALMPDLMPDPRGYRKADK